MVMMDRRYKIKPKNIQGFKKKEREILKIIPIYKTKIKKRKKITAGTQRNINKITHKIMIKILRKIKNIYIVNRIENKEGFLRNKITTTYRRLFTALLGFFDVEEDFLGCCLVLLIFTASDLLFAVEGVLVFLRGATLLDDDAKTTFVVLLL